MAWTTLPTYSDGNALTAAQMLAIAANINETAVAKATTGGYHFASTGTNGIAERAILASQVETSETTTDTNFNDLPGGTNGPEVSITTGVAAMVFMNGQSYNSNTNVGCYTSFAISGATTSASTDNRSIIWNATLNQALRMGVTAHAALTSGVNVFTMEYRVGGNTGTFSRRRLQIMGL